MSYEPTNWKTGDVVTSEKLNKLENGVANSGALKLNFTVDNEAHTITIDKTFAEIKEAVLNGINVFGIYSFGGKYYIAHPKYFEEDTNPQDEYHSVYIEAISSSQLLEFEVNTVNEYPVADIGGVS